MSQLGFEVAVADLTKEQALELLFEAYYGEGYAENHQIDDEDAELWGELSWTLSRTTQYNPQTQKHEPVEPKNVIRGVTIKCLEDFGGMDMGSERYVVFSMTDETGTRYFRKDGFYQSHYGTDWDGEFREVRPVEKTITVYEAK